MSPSAENMGTCAIRFSTVRAVAFPGRRRPSRTRTQLDFHFSLHFQCDNKALVGSITGGGVRDMCAFWKKPRLFLANAD